MNFEVDHHSETKLKMDIPKQPVKSVLSQSATNDSTASDTARLSSVQDLKLQPGKAYPARVIRGPESLPDETLKPSSAGRPSNAPPSSGSASVMPDAQTMTLKNDQYLVRINGKTVLVSSEKALEAGMKIILSTDPKSTIQRPSLIVQLAPESSAKQANPLFQKLSESLKTLAGQTLPTSTSLAQPNVSTQQIPQLLQALNVLLDKQVTLQTGLQQLSTYLASTPTGEQALTAERNQATGATTSRTPTSDSQLSPVVKATLQHLLHKTILKVEHLQALASHQPAFSSAQSAQSIQHSIRNSGLFLENSLSQQPANLTAFKAQLATLQHSLGLVSAANPDAKSTTNMTNSAAVQSLQKIQQTIDFLLSGAKSGPASSPLNQTQSDAIMQDLKASLLTASSLLARQLSKELSADALKNLFLLPQADTYALSPFAFPLLPSQQSGSAKPLFDKQNFTTGQ